ncbi:unnamed protein product [Rotaria sp. Silwood1]|nr:unnamed protein product [Rotaria sp. Silwood1]CAF1554710.1 unnamed protein product [Rotaria sp. Silwood1]
MTREKREKLAQRICNFYVDSSNKSCKTTVNYFIKQGVPRRTIYNILQRYLKHGRTKFLPKTGRPLKLSNKEIKQLVKSANNRCGISQRKLAKRYDVNQSTISRNLRRRTSLVIRRRRKAPRMDNKAHEKRARKNCGKLYKTTGRHCDIIVDDEKYFTLINANVGENQSYYSTDPKAAPDNIKFKTKKKFEPKLMIWMTRGVWV